jgi:acetyl esterase/lipase
MQGDTFDNTSKYIEAVYKSIGGHDLIMDIYRPLCNDKIKRPVSVYFHGGGWAIGTRTVLREDPVWERILNDLLYEGHIVIGAEFRLTGNNIRYPSHIEDCKDAVRWIKKNSDLYGFDPNRINVWGNSSGGHLALMTGLAPDELYAGDTKLSHFSSAVESIVSWFGPTDLVSWAKDENKPGWVNDFVFRFIGGDLGDSYDKFAEASPCRYIGKRNARILLIHGDADKPVDISQSQMLYDLALRSGINVDFIRVKNADHGSTEFLRDDAVPSIDYVLAQMKRFITWKNTDERAADE